MGSRRSAPMPSSKARVERRSPRPPVAACARRPCATSTPPAPTPAGRSARRMIPETHLLPLAADAALGLGPALTLLGTDYPTPDGSCIRDFVHVSDLADAHLRALGWLSANRTADGHEAFNLGSGTGYSVRQAIAETGRIAGNAVPHAVGRAPSRRFAQAGRRHRQGQARARLDTPTRSRRADRGHATLATQDAALTLVGPRASRPAQNLPDRAHPARS